MAGQVDMLIRWTCRTCHGVRAMAAQRTLHGGGDPCRLVCPECDTVAGEVQLEFLPIPQDEAA